MNRSLEQINKAEQVKRLLSKSVSEISRGDDLIDVLSSVSDRLTPYFDEKPRRHSIKNNKSFFDRTLVKLLSMIRSSTSKESLLKELFETLDNNDQHLVADFAFEIRFRVFEDQIELIEVPNIVGAHQKQTDNFRGAFRSRKQEIGLLLSNAIFEDSITEFMLIDPSDDTMDLYKNEFRELVSSKPFWLCLMPLPRSVKAEPARVICFIYTARSFGFQYEFPRGAIAEWQIIETLPSLYSVIDFQLGTLAEQVAAQRRNLIMELAPQAINHEITNQLGIIGDVRKRIGQKLIQLGKSLGASPAKFIDLRDELVRLRNATIKAQRSTEAFSNIERRSVLNRMLLTDLIDEVEVLYDYKLENKAIRLDYSSIDQIYIETDTTMVEHVLLNVVSNAIDAFPDEIQKNENRVICMQANINSEDDITIIVGNNGPPIPSSVRETLFQKGTTTKERGEGHGQGLYICRLVANFLRGDFKLSSMNIHGEPASVAFAFKFPINSSGSSELMTNEFGALSSD